MLLDLDHVTLFRDRLATYMADNHPGVRNLVMEGKITDELGERISRHVASFKKGFLQEHPNKSTVAEIAATPDDLAASKDARGQE